MSEQLLSDLVGTSRNTPDPTFNADEAIANIAAWNAIEATVQAVLDECGAEIEDGYIMFPHSGQMVDALFKLEYGPFATTRINAEMSEYMRKTKEAMHEHIIKTFLRPTGFAEIPV